MTDTNLPNRVAREVVQELLLRPDMRRAWEQLVEREQNRLLENIRRIVARELER